MQGRIEVEDKIEQGVINKLKNEPQFIADWYYTLRARGTTVKSCRDYVTKVEHFVSQQKIKDVKQITASDLSQYFMSIQYKIDRDGNKIKTSDSYKNSVWFALNNFFEYQYKIGNISKNIMSTYKPIHTNHQATKKKPFLTADDFKRMLDNIPGEDDNIEIRNKAILLLYMTTGMRRDALCQSNISDINWETHTMTVIDKGEKTHVYKLTKQTETAILNWMTIRKRYVKAPTNALFLTYQGKRITGNAVYNMITKCTQDTFGDSFSPHKLRAGLCSILYEQTHDIEFVRRSIGHSNVTTTQRYIITDGNEKEVASQIMEDLL